MSRLCRESGVIQCILAGRDPRNNARASSMTALTSPYNFPSNGRRCRWGCVAPQPSRSRTSHQIRFRKSDLALVTKAGEGESPGIVYQDFQSATRALQALEEYKLLLQQPEPDLLEGAVLIARHRHPMLELTDVVEVLDDLAEQVMPKLPAAAYPLRLVHAISEHLYVNRGFRGNSKSYYDPDNSCINVVLERRLGIPITLSLVYMEVAKRCDLHLHGVNVPGHFLLTPADPELEFFIDAFEGGQVSFLQDAEATLEKIYGRSVKLDPGFLQRKEQIPARVFLARMLNNLKSVYAARKDYSGAYQMSCYLRATRPGDLEEVRDQGFILWHMQRYAECAVALREYLDRAPEDAKDAPKVRRLLRVLRDVDQYADGGEDTPGAGMQ